MNQAPGTQNEEPGPDFSAVGPERVVSPDLSYVRITVKDLPVLTDEAGRQYIEDERGRRFVDEIPKNQSIRFTPLPTA